MLIMTVDVFVISLCTYTAIMRSIKSGYEHKRMTLVFNDIVQNPGVVLQRYLFYNSQIPGKFAPLLMSIVGTSGMVITR